MAKYLDSAGVTYLWKKIKANFVSNVTLASGTKNGTLKLTVNGTATDNIAVTGLGSAAYTASSAYAEVSHKTQIAKTDTLGHIKANSLFSGINVTLGSDTEKLPTSITLADVTTTANRFYPVYTDKGGVAFVNIPWTDTTYSAATTSTAGLMSAADKSKLNGIADGANNYTHPTSGVTAGTYKSVTVNAQGHVTAGTNPDTLDGYGITNAYTKTETDNLLGGYLKLSGGVRVLTEGITIQDGNTTANNISISGTELSIDGSATMNIGPNVTVTGLGSYPTDAGSDNRIASTKYVIDAINNKLAVADALIFKGVVNTPTDLSGKKDYKIGWTYKVGARGVYAGQTCEAGDMIIAVANYGTKFQNADWTVVQNNVDIAGKDKLGLGSVDAQISRTGNSSLGDGTAVDSKGYDCEYVKIVIDEGNCFCAAYPLAMGNEDIDTAIAASIADGSGDVGGV